MGLYLCVFDEAGEELEGVEVGSYADFNFFRDSVMVLVENGILASVCPTLQNHSDCDGEWSSADAVRLIAELRRVHAEMASQPAIELNSGWKIDVARKFGLKPNSLLECFFDVDGEPLVERLMELAQVSIESQRPIAFQ